MEIDCFFATSCLSCGSSGFGMGAGVLVGQNLGARQPERAERNAWMAVGILEAVMIVCSGAILLWADSIIGIFTTDPELIEIGGTFIRIAAAAFVTIGFISVLQSCIASAGDTVPNMIIAIIEIEFMEIPVINNPAKTPINASGTVPKISSGCVRLSKIAASSM